MKARPAIRRDCQHARARHQHGTYNAYKMDVCGCDDCKEAARIYRKRARWASERGRSNRVPAGPVIAHLEALIAAGWTAGRIAATAGVGVGHIGFMLGRTRKGDGSRYVLRRTEARIMALRPDGQDAGLTLAVGTHRRIQALVAIGWPQAWLCQRLGWRDESSMRQVLRRQRVTTATRDAVRDLYDELWDVTPTARTPNEQGFITRALNIAAARGWAPPMAWDEDAIDNPAGKPARVTRDRKADRDADKITETVRLLDACGPQGAARQLGYVDPRSLAQWLRRHGRPDLALRFDRRSAA